ncbi:hypothetical protein KQY10_00845 [Leptospira interrogans]|uniref:Tetratricopeptide repeat protein n=1 Tax=Leptospira interrogans serovar Hardjo str. Norma TaxID=1279460 RepID=A0A0M4NAN1_LEPIR|nr:hypothetical protein [Leptospira interrogans]ALE40352.1 hypothetical protein G436_3194 [Leptospira interrogans serovar Hardjo str. Norma]MCD1164203.1 hypothetical protein [Leptospira interrogans]MCH1887151.1 hypothetical protein [Leptospira interrogans]MCH1893452.1 hypothetical protein [Leptospira interrogans]MCH1903626.1 hypothetical protein [Leptospira interrogans]
MKKALSIIIVIVVSVTVFGKNRNFPKAVPFETKNPLLIVSENDNRQTSANESEVAKIIKLNNEKKYLEAKVSSEFMLRSVTSERLFHEYGRSLLGIGKFDDAKSAFQNSIRQMFATELPEESLYLISAAYSAEGRIQESLMFLQYAIDRGFSDLERVENEPLFESLRKGKNWKDLKQSLKTKMLNYSPSNLTGAITDLGPNSIVVHLLCPNERLVTYSRHDYDASKKVFLGNWSIIKNKLSLDINQKCFAKGVGKSRLNHNEQEVYDSYEYVGCVKSSREPKEILSNLSFTKSDLAALLRPYYGEEFEVEGIGFRYHKFANGLPTQCKDNFIPKSMNDLTIETKQYLKAY